MVGARLRGATQPGSPPELAGAREPSKEPSKAETRGLWFPRSREGNAFFKGPSSCAGDAGTDAPLPSWRVCHSFRPRTRRFSELHSDRASAGKHGGGSGHAHQEPRWPRPCQPRCGETAVGAKPPGRPGRKMRDGSGNAAPGWPSGVRCCSGSRAEPSRGLDAATPAGREGWRLRVATPPGQPSVHPPLEQPDAVGTASRGGRDADSPCTPARTRGGARPGTHLVGRQRTGH